MTADTHVKIIERLRELEQQFRAAGQLKPENGDTQMNTDKADKRIEAPFLCADDIVDRTDTATDEIIHEVIKNGKVLYSTVTRPLTFGFIAGFNAGLSKGGASKDDTKGSNDKGSKGKDNEPGDAPVKPPKSNAPIPASVDDAPRPDKRDVDAKPAQPEPRKRVAL
jgi:hypothetical protein